MTSSRVCLDGAEDGGWSQVLAPRLSSGLASSGGDHRGRRFVPPLISRATLVVRTFDSPRVV